MRRISQIMVTTHVDRHGERFAPEAIEDMARNFSGLVVPVSIEHDPRRPPIGRVLSGEPRTLEDGERALVGEIELFAPGDQPVYLGDDRQMPMHWRPAGSCSIEFDRNFRNDQDQEEIARLASTLRAHPREQFKKSLDPLGVLLVGLGCVAVGEIAKGFLSALGKDAYQHLKIGLKRIFSRKKEGEAEKLLLLSFAVTQPDLQYEVQIILTNPSDTDIELALDTLGPAVAEILERLPIRDARIQRVVRKLPTIPRHPRVAFTEQSPAHPAWAG